ncbi:stress enhanced protein 1 [Actinidia rufa]|uniref:Stress enhanced protein 1 n=1 Tax=Actinidia rufa TaxID=165716 RepID=A0A7J0EUF9_9ERIC|nr:stress enhanced protein 1 [Actinidia rufa]
MFLSSPWFGTPFFLPDFFFHCLPNPSIAGHTTDRGYPVRGHAARRVVVKYRCALVLGKKNHGRIRVLVVKDPRKGNCALRSPRTPVITRHQLVNKARIGNFFAIASPPRSLVIHNISFPVISRTTCRRKFARKAASLSIRCEQSSKEGNSLDVWLGRSAMVGFAVAISVEIATGKGLLENFGLTSPLPTVALGVTALVGVLTAIFIFQSASKS